MSKDRGGIGLVDVLLVVFIILKLAGVIDWSWWWVLSPLWFGIGMYFICYITVAVGK